MSPYRHHASLRSQSDLEQRLKGSAGVSDHPGGRTFQGEGRATANYKGSEVGPYLAYSTNSKRARGATLAKAVMGEVQIVWALFTSVRTGFYLNETTRMRRESTRGF